jgi:DNA-binding MarR family transcriptional regulator
MKITIIRQLLNWLEEYEAEIGGVNRLTKGEFAQWLLKEPEGEEPQEEEVYTDMYISSYLGYLQKFVTFYSRRIFRQSDIYSLDDYSFMVSLYPQNEMKKSELIQANAMEKSSGTEVIKRMLKRQQLEEFVHPEDRRAKMVALTEKGRNDLESVQLSMQRLTRLVGGNLEAGEKIQFLQLLKKLNFFHREVFEQMDEDNLKELLQISE